MKSRKGIFFLFISLLIVGGGGFLHNFFGRAESRWDTEGKKVVTVSDGGLMLPISVSGNLTVGELLETQKIVLNDGDEALPGIEERVVSGTNILIRRARRVTVKVDGDEKAFRTQMSLVEQALSEVGIALDEDDIVKPGRDALVTDNLTVTITRVEIKEETTDKPIAFEKQVNEDEKLSWRKAIVTQKGASGLRRLIYRVSRHDGKEVNRKLVATETLLEPVSEIVTQGTLVKVGKSHQGAASWYAYTGTLSAANPWLPLGSYVKVTNNENGKSVIVRINDRGPFALGRIIDLDKVAFQKIASIGAGVIDVKMEEILN